MKSNVDVYLKFKKKNMLQYTYKINLTIFLGIGHMTDKNNNVHHYYIANHLKF